MQKIETCLGFNDRAEEAVNFYLSVFKNSKILGVTRWGEMDPSKKEAVIAIEFEIGGERFLALNGGPSFTFTMGMSLMVNCDTQEEIDYYWEKLSEAGQEVECGWVTDKFGVSWQIVPSFIGEVLRDPGKAARALPAVWSMKKLDLAKIKAAAEGK